MIYGLVNRAQQLLARSRAAKWLAVRLRNQCQCVIRYRHRPVADPARKRER